MNKETKLTVVIVALLVVIAVLIAAIFGMTLKSCGNAAPEQEPTAVTLPAEETAETEDISETVPDVTEQEPPTEQQETLPEAPDPTEKPAAGNNPTEPTTPVTDPSANNPPAESDDDTVEGEVGLDDSPFDDE